MQGGIVLLGEHFGQHISNINIIIYNRDRFHLSDCMQSGDTFTVWYDKNNPSDVRNDNASYGRVVFVSLGGLLLLFCGGIMFPKER